MATRLAKWIGMMLLAVLLPARGEIGSEGGRSMYFRGRLDPGAAPNEPCVLDIEIEEIMFKLNSFKDKYKVVRIRVENGRKELLKLSAEKDAIELELSDGKTVRGTFNLQAQDGPIWDTLDESMRKALAYPLSIRGAKGDDPNGRRPEVVHLFAFFPSEKVTGLPRAFSYMIQSVGKTVRIVQPPPTAN